MYLSNLEEYGHLINAETFDTKLINPDVYELLTNRVDWEQRYISPQYPENLNPNKTADQVSARLIVHLVITVSFPVMRSAKLHLEYLNLTVFNMLQYSEKVKCLLHSYRVNLEL